MRFLFPVIPHQIIYRSIASRAAAGGRDIAGNPSEYRAKRFVVAFLIVWDELIEGKRETSFWFPDQPLNVILRNEKNNRNGLLIIIGKKTYMVEKKEFFLEILSAADVFWELLAQCDVSVLERKNKIQEIRKKL